MSEALDLEWKDVDLRGKQAVVWQKQGNERRLDLVPVVMEALEALPHRHGHVFRPVQIRRRFKGADPERITGDRYHNNGRTSGGQIKSGWAAACRKAKLPANSVSGSPKAKPQNAAYSSQTSRHTISAILGPPGTTAYTKTSSA
ncbi:hypothetical protein GRO01_12070 [Gluconobacter roseus NBRC 3990]|uniref:Tyr recombinase domain-containing protein n=1 Tax=Gluconobacter roseus NBRC 3990 TaxID=1307950 RepID=A0A4Y3M8M2_9PROT|nr:hypothetical protein GRO01_12070 [Gluconobacter roseus NBRC 3990]GLP94086.1 hypothetical protein GCM10007871_20640 [Gluconobacter roseus NBRC 3990]